MLHSVCMCVCSRACVFLLCEPSVCLNSRLDDVWLLWLAVPCVTSFKTSRQEKCLLYGLWRPDAADPDNGSVSGGKDGEVAQPAVHTCTCGFMDRDASNQTLGHCYVHTQRQLLHQRHSSMLLCSCGPTRGGAFPTGG